MFSCVSLTSPLTSQNLRDARKDKANVELICPIYRWNTGLGIFRTPVYFVRNLRCRINYESPQESCHLPVTRNSFRTCKSIYNNVQ